MGPFLFFSKQLVWLPYAGIFLLKLSKELLFLSLHVIVWASMDTGEPIWKLFQLLQGLFIREFSGIYPERTVKRHYHVQKTRSFLVFERLLSTQNVFSHDTLHKNPTTILVFPVFFSAKECKSTVIGESVTDIWSVSPGTPCITVPANWFFNSSSTDTEVNDFFS